MSSHNDSPLANRQGPNFDLPYMMDWGTEPQLPLPSSTASSSRATGSPQEQRLKRSVEDAGLDQHEGRAYAGPGPSAFIDAQYRLLLDDVSGQVTSEDIYATHFAPNDLIGEGGTYLVPDQDYRQTEELAAIIEECSYYLSANPTVDVLPNPFADHLPRSEQRYQHRVHATAPAGGEEVNGYVKFKVEPRDCGVQSAVFSGRRQTLLDRGIRHRSPPVGFMQSSILYLPEAFGLKWRPTGMDRELLDFYARAFCAGRTLLDQTNAYLQIMRMVDDSECVRHSVLALAAGYLLDYWPDNGEIRSNAIDHYRAAVQQLTHDLNDVSIQEVGKEDSTVGSLVLLLSDDIVNWEHREAALQRDPHAHARHDPLWRQGSQVARRILDASDPGRRYWQAGNVQISEIRAANANMVAFAEICALPVTPLVVEDWDRLFPWLLGGSKDDVSRIHGGTGVSPKLLHTIAQITQLTALASKNPRSVAFPIAAEQIDQCLDSLKQWSQISHGYNSVHELLDACSVCNLDEAGFVHDNGAMVTDLTGETWRQAAKIYLHCRFYRLPRNHPMVQTSLGHLLQCLERMPTSGKLFTAQSPFFCVFLAALVACTESHREVVRNWFNAVTSTVRARSVSPADANVSTRVALREVTDRQIKSVPPIWRTVREYWEWVDEEVPLNEEIEEIHLTDSLGCRQAWWEMVVERFMEREGQLSLI